MEIGPLSNQQTGQQADGPERPKPKSDVPESGGKEVVDRVEISPDARSRQAKLADHDVEKELSVPTPVDADRNNDAERLEAIRRRIESGYYDRPDVQAEVAEKLIDDWDS